MDRKMDGWRDRSTGGRSIRVTHEMCVSACLDVFMHVCLFMSCMCGADWLGCVFSRSCGPSKGAVPSHTSHHLHVRSNACRGGRAGVGRWLESFQVRFGTILLSHR